MPSTSARLMPPLKPFFSPFASEIIFGPLPPSARSSLAPPPILKKAKELYFLFISRTFFNISRNLVTYGNLHLSPQPLKQQQPRKKSSVQNSKKNLWRRKCVRRAIFRTVGVSCPLQPLLCLQSLCHCATCNGSSYNKNKYNLFLSEIGDWTQSG